MEEKPEAIEISPGDDEDPWGKGSASATSETLLSGDVTSFGGEGSNSPYWAESGMESKGLSNGAWFAIGLILAPGAMWFVSFIMFTIGDSMDYGADEIFYGLGMLLWPAGLIGGLVWSFTKGNKYFAYGLLTALVGVPAVLFLALIVMILTWI